MLDQVCRQNEMLCSRDEKDEEGQRGYELSYEEDLMAATVSTVLSAPTAGSVRNSMSCRTTDVSRP